MDEPLSSVIQRVDTGEARLRVLKQLERKLLWLSSWMIHHANHIRPNRDGLKVGGHQASCASSISILTALYFDIARAQDRIAVKPHAGPVFHAINYLLGRQTLEKMETLRAFGGIQTLFCVVSFTSDWLFPTSESRALVHALNASSARVSFAEIETDRGHDAFLLDVPEFFDISRAFLQSAGKARGLRPPA